MCQSNAHTPQCNANKSSFVFVYKYSMPKPEVRTRSTTVFSTLASRRPLVFATSETHEEKGRLRKFWARIPKRTDRRGAAVKSVVARR